MQSKIAMAPISIPGVSIRPSRTAPGIKNISKKKKRKPLIKRPFKNPLKRTGR